jgi:hypothetical protein
MMGTASLGHMQRIGDGLPYPFTHCDTQYMHIHTRIDMSRWRQKVQQGPKPCPNGSYVVSPHMSG